MAMFLADFLGLKLVRKMPIIHKGEIISIRSSSSENSVFFNVFITVMFSASDKGIITSEGKSVIDVRNLKSIKMVN